MNNSCTLFGPINVPQMMGQPFEVGSFMRDVDTPLLD